MSKTKNNKIRTCELFGGVGGFRLGLKGWNGKSSTSGYKEDLNSKYEVVFSNQWEPSTKIQHASMVYENRWGKDGHTNVDITTLDTDKYEELLVNPTLLTIARQRGNIDCGGLRFIIVGYGNFYQLVKEIKNGHISICLEKNVDLTIVPEKIFEFLKSKY